MEAKLHFRSKAVELAPIRRWSDNGERDQIAAVPAIFFSERWGTLRSRLGNDLTALYCFNAPYPEPADPSDLFYANGRSDEAATELYSIGRSVVKDCRKLFLDRKLVATGIQSDGKRARIPADA